jgi:hypothetical protein
MDFIGACSSKALISWSSPMTSHRVLVRRESESDYWIFHESTDLSYALITGLEPDSSYEVAVEGVQQVSSKVMRATISVKTNSSSVFVQRVHESLVIAFWDESDQLGYYDVLVDGVRVAQYSKFTEDSLGLCKIHDNMGTLLDLYFQDALVSSIPVPAMSDCPFYRYIKKGCVYNVSQFEKPLEIVDQLALSLSHGDVVRYHFNECFTFVDRSGLFPGNTFVLNKASKTPSICINSIDICIPSAACSVMYESERMWFISTAQRPFYQTSNTFRSKSLQFPTAIHGTLVMSGPHPTHSALVDQKEVVRETAGRGGYSKYVRDNKSMKKIIQLDGTQCSIMSCSFSDLGLSVPSFLSIGPRDFPEETLTMRSTDRLEFSMGAKDICKL